MMELRVKVVLLASIRDADSLNKVLVDSTNNHLEFYVKYLHHAVQQLRIQDGAIVPITDNDIDLGTSSLEFKDLFIDGTAKLIHNYFRWYSYYSNRCRD